MNNKRTKLTGFILIGISAIPLLFYPFVLLANAMSLAGHKAPDSSFFDVFIPYFFIIATTVYPITIIVSLLLFRYKKNIKFAFLPYVNLLLIGLAYLLWEMI
ncbi:hypothetical protein [Brumimicrobium mesophilum]|uniref:hypothetical protein n=1 Tax=Brumimicrobium mesophilum TaxID=392717 RepID=UPI000D14006F|nr:hypothetical protein [Brumimicrobium mesophilum]